MRVYSKPGWVSDASSEEVAGSWRRWGTRGTRGRRTSPTHPYPTCSCAVCSAPCRASPLWYDAPSALCVPQSFCVASRGYTNTPIRLQEGVQVEILSEGSSQVLGKGNITKGALDTRWCHYQTLAPTQKGEKPAPEDENDRENDPLNSAFLDGACCTAPTANHPGHPLRIL